ncbi:MAG: glycerol dehydrogenase [Treponemataceae bacterium]|nr:MAG: glycerol dehydrogenase [Treponemataceae bacterium]
MANIIGSPSRYIQGKNELENICQYAQKFGKKIFVLVSKSGKERVESIIAESAKKSGATVAYEIFNGECSNTEIKRVEESFKKSGSDVIAAVGGGKIHDTGKVAAFYAEKPVIIVPTIASTDAPCSALSVIYTDDGVFEKYLFLPANPNIVLVDTAIVSKAPARLLVSGMGDALATYFEARACKRSDAGNCVSGKSTLTAQALARLCYDTLIADGVHAAIAAQKGACTKAVENIIEANTYLSGIGFESGGLAAAHAVHNGLTAIPETHKFYHGEKVAFGTLVQLVLENAPQAEFDEVIEFCLAVGLPVCLADLDIKSSTDTHLEKRLMEVATLACADSDTMGNMPFAVTPLDVYNAILGADAIGSLFKE